MKDYFFFFFRVATEKISFAYEKQNAACFTMLKKEKKGKKKITKKSSHKYNIG